MFLSETIATMHLSGMRPAPKLARGQLATGIGAERTANAKNNETGGVMTESRRYSPVSANAMFRG
jgi:hypothetical protein